MQTVCLLLPLRYGMMCLFGTIERKTDPGKLRSFTVTPISVSLHANMRQETNHFNNRFPLILFNPPVEFIDESALYDRIARFRVFAKTDTQFGETLLCLRSGCRYGAN